MSLDQKIQVWVAVGTWVAGLATLAAAVVALHLARRAERVRLKVHVGLRELVYGDGSPAQEHLCFDVTNLADRAVTINSIGWAVGKGKTRRYCLQPESGVHTSRYPIDLSHGKNAKFMVSFIDTPSWVSDFARRFVEDLSDKNLRTLVAQIHTSVGTTVEVRPEPGLLETLRRQRTP
jgi:hypothetical protein